MKYCKYLVVLSILYAWLQQENFILGVLISRANLVWQTLKTDAELPLSKTYLLAFSKAVSSMRWWMEFKILKRGQNLENLELQEPVAKLQEISPRLRISRMEGYKMAVTSSMQLKSQVNLLI